MIKITRDYMDMPFGYGFSFFVVKYDGCKLIKNLRIHILIPFNIIVGFIVVLIRNRHSQLRISMKNMRDYNDLSFFQKIELFLKGHFPKTRGIWEIS